MASKWVKIGECAVDTGTLIIADPVNLKGWTAEDAQLCGDAAISKDNQVLNGLAVAVSTHGDGCFEVSALMDDEGIIKKVEIDFTGEPDVDDLDDVPELDLDNINFEEREEDDTN